MATRKFLAGVGLVLMVGLGGGTLALMVDDLWGPLAGRAEAASLTPRGVNYAIQVDVVATPVPVTPLPGREGIIIQNLGPNDLFCGFSASVTTVNGLRVGPGDTMGLALSHNRTHNTGHVWCVAASAAQVSPADTRVGELL